jgi:transcriptional regulator with XRE-family HTH domain
VRPQSLAQLQKQLGQRIREVRVQAKMRQEDVAHEAGLDVKRYQKLEYGTVNATLRTLQRVATGLGTDFWTLMRKPGGRT